jgi:hypothetical protein
MISWWPSLRKGYDTYFIFHVEYFEKKSIKVWPCRFENMWIYHMHDMLLEIPHLPIATLGHSVQVKDEILHVPKIWQNERL